VVVDLKDIRHEELLKLP